MTATTTELQSTSGLVLHPGEGRTLSLLGATIGAKVTGADTDGAWSLVEYTAPPHFAGPAPHGHRQTDEAFYILEGTPTFQLGEDTMTVEPGAFVFVPRGVVHTFRNSADVPARFLIFFSPAGFEGYWDELAELAHAEKKWPPSDVLRLIALGEKYDSFAPQATA